MILAYVLPLLSVLCNCLPIGHYFTSFNYFDVGLSFQLVPPGCHFSIDNIIVAAPVLHVCPRHFILYALIFFIITSLFIFFSIRKLYTSSFFIGTKIVLGIFFYPLLSCSATFSVFVMVSATYNRNDLMIVLYIFECNISNEKFTFSS